VLRNLAVKYGLASRDAKWQLYSEFFPPRIGEQVLDVGVSQFDDLPGSNYFLRRYPYPEQVTAVGISDLTGLRSRYQGIRFVEADGRQLPFEDRAFDVVHSNAVVEHVGPELEQIRFIGELARVGRAGFITTPNRWFPIEPHFRLPVIHWLPRPAAVWALRRLSIRQEWKVFLLSSRRFKRLFPHDLDITFLTQRMAGWPATFIVLFRRRR
jgi:Methyltransferase domain